MRIPLALCVLLVMLGGTAEARGKQVTYAIVIGNNAPPTGTNEALPALRYADDDAVRYYQLLSRIAEAHLFAVLDVDTQRRYPGLASRVELPTLAAVNRLVEDLATKMESDLRRGDRPVLYFTFSGHGARDDRGQPFLALLDGALTQQRLYEELLARMPTAFTHVIVDACHAGGVVGVRGDFFGKEANTVTVPVSVADARAILQTSPLAKYPHIGVIVGATLGQESHEWSEVEAGVFTHELLSGLAGAADINGDQAIEYSEIEAFVAAANRDLRDPRAAPFVIARPPSADHNVPLVALRGLSGTRLVRGNAAKLGHFYIELANGQRYLDAHVDDRELVLALPDAPAFLRTSWGEASLPRGRVDLSKVQLTARRIASRGAIEAAYQASLFASPYNRDYYQGFIDSSGAIGVSFAPPGLTEPVAPRRPPAPSKRLAIGSLVIAGVAATTSIVFGVRAYNARADYDATQVQVTAYEATQRYERALPISVTSGVLAVAAGAAAWWLWPSSNGTRVVAPTVAEHGGYGVALGLTW